MEYSEALAFEFPLFDLILVEYSETMFVSFLFFGSGSWIRTNGLRVMSPTSYLCSTPQRTIIIEDCLLKVK